MLRRPLFPTQNWNLSIVAVALVRGMRIPQAWYYSKIGFVRVFLVRNLSPFWFHSSTQYQLLVISHLFTVYLNKNAIIVKIIFEQQQQTRRRRRNGQSEQNEETLFSVQTESGKDSDCEARVMCRKSRHFPFSLPCQWGHRALSECNAKRTKGEPL